MNAPSPGANRNAAEAGAASALARLFAACPDPDAVKLDNFPKYVRIQALTRFLSRYELFRKVLTVKGSIIECGVYKGAGLMTWAGLSAILEPSNFQRRVYGFDTFSGFPQLSSKDAPTNENLQSDSREELDHLLAAFDNNRYLGHMPKVELVAGDAVETIPQFLTTHPHLVVALLYLDFDLYEPTLAALRHFVPRMPRGAVLAFDELDHPAWPGETQAVLEELGIGKLRLERVDFEPYASYAVLP